MLPYVTSGDGFYTDGSFIQHNRHPYTGGYGLGLLANLSRLLYLLDGSPWSVTDPMIENVFAWVTHAYEPWLYRGSMMSPVRGRNISRHSQQDHASGHDAVRAILWASQFAPAGRAEAFRGLVKHTVEQDEFRNFLDYLARLHAATWAIDPAAFGSSLPRWLRRPMERGRWADRLAVARRRFPDVLSPAMVARLESLPTEVEGIPVALQVSASSPGLGNAGWRGVVVSA